MSTIEERIALAKKEILDTSNIATFNRLYCFTTENINGYIDRFNLKGKSLLTVGSSSDQVLNAHFLGCKDITLIDINKFTKEFFYLKKAAIERLSYKQFFKFMSMEGTVIRNRKSFNKKTFNKIIEHIEDPESKHFWKEIVTNFEPKQIKKLFTPDVPFTYELKELNNYLQDEESYHKIKKTIKKLKPKFITANIYKYKLKRNYDNIFLSNIADYNDVDETYKLYNRLKDNINAGGAILIAYLYGPNYMSATRKINDIEKTEKKFSDAHTFQIRGREDIELRIRENSPASWYLASTPDELLVYRKK
ncbi:MAG: DUF3419 family protein [Bacilli bacterium]|nr:DUF3419 family protein [Bacilli bacterium]